MASPIAAAHVYASLAKIGAGGSAPAAGLAKTGAAAGPSFGELVENVLTSVVTKGREADAKTIQMAAGKADLVDVVTAVAETEVAVETLVSVRDRVISAYEEIFRMPI